MLDYAALKRLLMTAFIALLAITGYLVLGGAVRRMGTLRDAVSDGFLQQTQSKLLTWHPLGLEDLSSLCRSTDEYTALGGGLYHSRGTIQSRSNVRDAWLAYTVNSRHGIGTVDLRTSANKLVLEMAAGEIRHAIVTLDCLPLGKLHLAATVTIFDALGRRLGEVTGGRRAVTYGMTNYRDVQLNGRYCAQVNTNLIHPGQRPGWPPPALIVHDPKLSPEEGWWLLALLALELFRDRNRFMP